MKTRYNELGIGVSVTAATAIVILGVLVLSGTTILNTGLRVQMIVSDAQGLASGDDIEYRGISIGSVQSLEILDDGVHVQMKMKGSPRIPSDSRFTIKDAGLLGGKTVEITPGKSSEILINQSFVKGESQNGLFSLAEDSSGLQKQLNSILANIDSLSGAATLKNLYSLIDNLNANSRGLQAILEENRASIASSITNLQQISGENREPVKETIASLNQSIHSIDQTMSQLQTVIGDTGDAITKLNQVLADVQSGKGTLGKLVTDDSLYTDMQAAVSKFSGLVDDIKKNPQRYVTVKVF